MNSRILWQSSNTSKPAWTPANLPSTSLWLDVSEGSSLSFNGATVSQVLDKSPFARHATQPTPANQPTYLPTAINGLPALSFNGTSNRLSLTTPTGGDISRNVPYVGVFAVCALANNASNRVLFFTPAAANTTGITVVLTVSGGILRAGGRRLYTDGFAIVDSPGSTLVVDEPFIYGFEADHSATQARLQKTGNSVGTNASFQTAGNNQDSTAANFVTIGSSAASIDFWSGLLGEIIVVNQLLSLEDRQRIEGYLAHKWGLSSQLPALHPYKSNLPRV